MNIIASQSAVRTSIRNHPMTDAERSRRARRRKQIHRETAEAFGLSPITILLPDYIVDQMIDIQGGTIDYVPTDLIIFKALYDYLSGLSDEEKDNPAIVDLSTQEGSEQALRDAFDHAAKIMAKEAL